MRSAVVSSMLLALVAVAASRPLSAQDLTGRYVFHGAAGDVTLALEQQGALVRGTMQGADGAVFQLEGQVEAGRTTGRIVMGESAGWFGAGLVQGGLKVIVAELDALGQPNLASAWELDFVPIAAPGQYGQAATPAAPGPGVPAPSPAPGGVASQREDTPLLNEWLGHLRGKRLTYMDSYASGGGSGGYSDRWEADLCSDGTFIYRSSSMVSADVGGVGGYSAGSGGARGIWRLVEQRGQAVLQYRMDDGTEDQALLTYRDGKTYFGDQRVFVTEDNRSCY